VSGSAGRNARHGRHRFSYTVFFATVLTMVQIATFTRRLSVLALAAALGLATLPATAARHVPASNPTPAQQRAAAKPSERPDPDTMLIEVYKELAANHLVAAQSKVDALVAAYPNFRLGQLIRGDLLLMHTRAVTTFGAVNASQPESIENLKNLREEAVARLRSLRERPNPELVPRAVLQLRDDQRHVLVVDARRSRLYVYENLKGRLKFITDYYISQGKLGVNKIREGDQKTPVGVYYITSRLASARLPDFYGAGALPISYPNEWDRINGRSGSGIWLHGTPSDTYSRPPLSSDGCVVLTNPDLNKLYGTVEIGRTPIVISDQVEFVSPAKWDAERGIARRLVENWKRDLESLDPLRVKSHYSTRFRTEHGETLDAWLDKQKQWLGSVPSLAVTLRDLSLFVYPGQNDLMVATFTQDAQIGKARHSVRKRQYWAREGAQWHIVAESTWQG
jgi:murein L,D-transpeptidase YafK